MEGKTNSKSWKDITVLLLWILVGIDLVVILLNYLYSHFQIVLPIPAPGSRLNNPIGALLILLFIIGVLDINFRESSFSRIRKLLISVPQKYYFFGTLLALEIVFECIHLTYPKGTPEYLFFWDLNVEQGYPTYFSTFQLYLLGMVTVRLSILEKKPQEKFLDRWKWTFISSIFLYLALDEVLGIHDQVGWFGHYLPDFKIIDKVYVWMWFYAPFIFITAVYLLWFFMSISKDKKSVRVCFCSGLGLWIFSLLVESLSKQRPVEGYILHAWEEGAEMLGATLLILGFSLYWKEIYSEKNGFQCSN